jgi:hypothetical protein
MRPNHCHGGRWFNVEAKRVSGIKARQNTCGKCACVGAGGRRVQAFNKLRPCLSKYDKREKERNERKGDNHMEFEAISAARCPNALEHMFAIPVL